MNKKGKKAGNIPNSVDALLKLINIKLKTKV